MTTPLGPERDAGGVAGTVRRASLADAETMGAVHVTSWRAAYRHLLADTATAGPSVASRVGLWRRVLADPGATVWVADLPGAGVVGFASTGPSRDDDMPAGTGELYALYVHPDSWGAGAGGRLLTEATSDLTARFGTATLWVVAANARARGLYSRHGWQPDGARRRVERDGGSLDELRCRLGPGQMLHEPR